MKRWKRRDDWVGTQVEDHFVMINVESGRYIALNATAAEAWHLLGEPSDQGTLAGAMTRIFDVDLKTSEQSVSSLMDRMQSLELVEEAA